MSDTRITGDEVRQRFPQQDPECCDCSPGSECRVQSSNRFTVRLIKQLDADARRLADLEAALHKYRLAAEANESDAEEYRALARIEAHQMRHKSYPWGMSATAREWFAHSGEGRWHGALTPSALLAQLDALADVRKPTAEPERWRVRDEHGDLWGRFHSPAEARKWMDDPGDYPRSAFSESAPVREVKNTAGDVLLLREGRPIPEGWS